MIPPRLAVGVVVVIVAGLAEGAAAAVFWGVTSGDAMRIRLKRILMKKYWLTWLAVAGAALAGEFKPGQVPAGAQWFAHWDVAAFKRSEIGQFGLEQVAAFAPAVDGLAAVLKFDPRKDLNGVTVFGTVADNGEGEVQAKGTVLVEGKFNQAHLLTLLSTNETVKEEKVNGAEIISWVDNDKQSFGAFSGRNHLLIGDDRGLLLKSLQVLQGKAPGLKVAGLGELAKGNYLLLSARTQGLPFPAEAKVLEHVQAVALTLGEAEKNFVISARVTTANEEVGGLIQKAIEGLAAVGRLQLWETEEPNLKELEALLREVEIVKRNNTVTVRLSVPVKKILDLGATLTDQ